jgi:hypothetical protein
MTNDDDDILILLPLSTNVPDVRVSFRHELLVNELMNLFKFKTDKTNDLEV